MAAYIPPGRRAVPSPSGANGRGPKTSFPPAGAASASTAAHTSTARAPANGTGSIDRLATSSASAPISHLPPRPRSAAPSGTYTPPHIAARAEAERQTYNNNNSNLNVNTLAHRFAQSSITSTPGAGPSRLYTPPHAAAAAASAAVSASANHTRQPPQDHWPAYDTSAPRPSSAMFERDRENAGYQYGQPAVRARSGPGYQRTNANGTPSSTSPQLYVFGDSFVGPMKLLSTENARCTTYKGASAKVSDDVTGNYWSMCGLLFGLASGADQAGPKQCQFRQTGIETASTRSEQLPCPSTTPLCPVNRTVGVTHLWECKFGPTKHHLLVSKF